jgi:hypothetical protein
MVRMNVLPPSSRSWSNRSKDSGFLLAVGLLGLLFDPEDGGRTLLPDILKLLPDYMTSHPRRYCLFLTFSEIILAVDHVQGGRNHEFNSHVR